LSPSFAKWEANVLHQKKKIMDGIPAERLHVIAPSRWMAQAARESPAFGRFMVHHVPYGLDTRILRPGDKAAVRAVLGLPDRSPIVGFAAQGLADGRKGLAVLLEALRSLGSRGEAPLLVTVGQASSEVPGLGVVHLGSITSERMLSLFYNALDLFICPSLQDNLPNTVLEAMSCGTPVVAFDVGGLPDMVRPGETGWLVGGVGDSSELAATLKEALGRAEERRKRGAMCRQVAESEYDGAHQADTIAGIYREVLGLRRTTPEDARVSPGPQLLS
jgi:glycosyltransferase involved in cell wall biosynthesis